jgi:predicted DNA-binding transcriptional regulator YafY
VLFVTRTIGAVVNRIVHGVLSGADNGEMRSERLLALLFTLQSRRRATVAELAGALGVSERTMHRDLSALQAAGVPLWSEPGRGGGVRLVEGWRTRMDGLTSREAAALLTLDPGEALAQLGLGGAVTAAHAKLDATLPTPLREQARRMAQRVHLDAPEWFHRDEQAEHLTAVARAVWEQRRTRIDYRRADRTVRRVVDPLGLVLKAGVWYLVARVDEAVRTYRVGRITAAEDTGQTFTRPQDFDLAAWWRESAVGFERAVRRTEVRVRLTPHGVHLLAKLLDPEMALAALADAGPADEQGGREVTLALEKPEIAAHQLLGLGAEVEILEPDEVRRIFAEVTHRMSQRHQP